MNKNSSNALTLTKCRVKRIKREKDSYIILLLLLILLIVFAFSFCIGSYKLSIGEVITIFYGRLMGISNSFGANVDTVVFLVRMPRIIAALIIGGALSVAGSSYQGLFRNPMVSPDILGASGGAGFGAALGLLLSLDAFEVQMLSFLCGLGAVLAAVGIHSIIKRDGGGSLLSLIMIGIVISSLAQAFISLIKYVGDPEDKLPVITFWLMGSLSTVTMNDLFFLLIPIIIAIVPLYLLRWHLNILSFGDEEATALGVNVRKMKLVVIICSTLATAVTVSVAGVIGWIGLIIPHLARMLVGPNYKRALPASLLIGSIYLILVDDLCLFLLSP